MFAYREAKPKAVSASAAPPARGRSLWLFAWLAVACLYMNVLGLATAQEVYPGGRREKKDEREDE